ncbi:MAG: MarR family transcriptional regulator [Clostridia bacterium]|nr:MarR family transcriptional regulator [Clostridia bacterium]
MEYLKYVLGIKTVYQENKNMQSLPNYILARYDVKTVTLDGVRAAFVYPKNELDSVNTVKKHLDRIRTILDAKPVLVFDRLTFRQKEYLLRDHVPFIVEGKQIYLPFMAAYLQERCDGEKRNDKSLLPSAQLLLLYFIYQGCGEILTSDAARALGFTATSISRASKQLDETGLLKTQKRGIQKVLYSDKMPEKLFEEARRYLMNPVKRTVYVPKKDVKGRALFGGYSALSEYSMLNPPAVECYATDSISRWDKSMSGTLQNENDQCAVELWRYDPKKLADGKCVDRLSLALALQDDKDERTEEAVEEMLAQVWRNANGKRN